MNNRKKEKAQIQEKSSKAISGDQKKESTMKLGAAMKYEPCPPLALLDLCISIKGTAVGGKAW